MNQALFLLLKLGTVPGSRGYFEELDTNVPGFEEGQVAGPTEDADDDE